MEKKRINIILFGTKNVGKTTTLMRLAMKLAGTGTVNTTTEKQIISLFGISKKRFRDARFIVEYKKKLIYIGTGGDYWSICRGNCQFFEGDFKSNLCIHHIDTKGIVSELSINEKKLYKECKPDVCICACRPSGDSFGTIKALHSYSETHILNYTVQLWIQAFKNKSNETQATELIQIIDQFFPL